MARYITYDTITKEFTGFYDDQVNEVIPDFAIQITKQQHIDFLIALNEFRDVLVGDLVIKHIPPQTFPLTWEDIRFKRNSLLEESDYTQISDWNGDKQAWAAYRQILRDIPNTYSDPTLVVWPTPPGS